MANQLYYGDNLEVLREHIKNESVDLIYLDPPFNSNATYNVLFRSPVTGDHVVALHSDYCQHDFANRLVIEDFLTTLGTRKERRAE